MWPRIAEIFPGIWLLSTPFVFAIPASAESTWFNNMSCGVVVIAMDLHCLFHRASRAHLLNLAIGLWLVALAYHAGPAPATPPYASHFVTGIVLALFSIIPNEANRPPRSWREFEARAISA